MGFSKREFLAHTQPFNGLPRQELDRLSQIAQLIQHQKGEYIFSEGEEATSIWSLVQGRLDIYKYTSDGKPRVIETIFPKDLFGTLCRLGGEGRTYPCTAMAVEPSQSLRIADSVFLNLYARYPSMVSGVCTLCSQRLNQMQDISCLSQEPVEKRIIRVLMSSRDKYGSTIPLTKKEISEMAGTTVETTIRTMSQFQKKNWISSTRGKITLIDINNLETLLN